MTPFVPYYLKSPNKLVRKFTKEFSDGVGNSAELTIAEFLDKNKNLQQAVIQVKWR